jgi:cobalt-zinc-cadmium efflux system outer membrane protein
MSSTRISSLVVCSCLTIAIHTPGRLDAESTPGGGPLPFVTLAEAREKALAASPDLRSLAAAASAAEGALRQAKAFANPELLVEAEDFGGTLPADAAAQRTFTIGQSVEWFGKRSARVEAAQRAGVVAALDLERRRRDVLAGVDRRFAAVLAAQERLALADENVRTAREVTAAVSALVAAGEVSPIEEARAQSDEALAVIDRANAERDVELARRELAQQWGEGQVSLVGGAGRLAEAADLPDLDAALAAVVELPDLARWDAEVLRLEALQTLAKRQSLPDFALSVGTRSYGGSDDRAYVAGLAMPIPLWTQFAGARAEASARLEQVKHETRAEETRIRIALLAAHRTVSRAVDEARSLREDVLPRALTVYEALNEGYRRGKFRLLDLLEARRTLAQTRLRYVDALVRLNVADADLRRLLPAAAPEENGVK